ncbi:Uma2 family endonuclease [Streptomyces sp. WMMB303]|uniref:Uma2 family endonuclease n=1 Tax=Streptomyces sp. WMMB303 TaxID=3034154 RepID=UPI0023ECCD1B|nr:Uma2 family endonuclease [Streptomyces sp. WMMB303]MDF4254118.1 Uma2 family endonuclease [Streptomyces sp. WMMB303]
MPISETDRLHSQLSRLEDQFPGFRTEIVGGTIMMSPVRPFHGRTIRLLENTFEAQLGTEWACISDVTFVFSDADELCPDIALVPRAEADRNLSAYPPDLIELAVEVVSPSSVRHDYVVKDRLYAQRGIARYLIFDPYRAECTTLWHPGPDGYRGRDVIPYGKPVELALEIGEVRIETDELPVDRETRTQHPGD